MSGGLACLLACLREEAASCCCSVNRMMASTPVSRNFAFRKIIPKTGKSCITPRLTICFCTQDTHLLPSLLCALHLCFFWPGCRVSYPMQVHHHAYAGGHHHYATRGVRTPVSSLASAYSIPSSPLLPSDTQFDPTMSPVVQVRGPGIFIQGF